MYSIVTALIEFLFLGIHASVTERSDLIVIILILIFSIAFFYDITRSKKLSYVQLPLAVGYLWRLVLLFWDMYCKGIIGVPHSGADSEGYFEHAVRVATGGVATYGGLYSRLMGKIFSWTGITRIYGQFVNCMFSLIALCAIVFALEKIGVAKNIQRKVLWVVCLLPNYASLSAIFMRESIISMSISVSIYLFVRWFQKRKAYMFWGAFILVFFASAFHSGTVGVAVGYVVIRFLYDANRRKFRIKAINIVPVVFLVVLFVFLYTNYATLLFGKMHNLDLISESIRSSSGRGGSSYAAYVGDGRTPMRFLLFSGIRLIYFLFSPFPWQWRGVGDIIAFCFDSLFYGICIWSAISYLKSRRKENRNLVLALLIIALCVVFIFAWGVSNTGTAIRHRDKLIAIFSVLWGATTVKDRAWISANNRRI